MDFRFCRNDKIETGNDEGWCGECLHMIVNSLTVYGLRIPPKHKTVHASPSPGSANKLTKSCKYLLIHMVISATCHLSLRHGVSHGGAFRALLENILKIFLVLIPIKDKGKRRKKSRLFPEE